MFVASNWKALEKNTLKGFFDLTISLGEEDLNLVFILRGATYHERDESRWVSMPARPYKDSAGKETWANIVDWPGPQNKREFLSMALEALDRDILKKQA